MSIGSLAPEAGGERPFTVIPRGVAPGGWVRRLVMIGCIVVTAATMAGCATTAPGSSGAGGAGQSQPRATRTADAGGFVSRAVDATTAAVQRLRSTLESQELARKFHDAAEHGEEAVLALLRRAGIGQGAGKSGDGRSGAGRSGAGKSGAGKSGAGKGGTGTAPGPVADGSLRWPVDAGVISSEFGHRWGRQHRGIDIAGTIGEPILAAADGEVLYSGSGLSGYGNVVILRHANEATTLYAHNSDLKVRVGQRVRQGEIVALLGNTGRSTGPHLHFEVRRGELALDPRAVLPPTQLAGGRIQPVAALR